MPEVLSSEAAMPEASRPDPANRPRKVVVLDLDDTVWEGVLLEGGGARLLPSVREVLTELDARGVLLSVASRNEAEPALARLAEHGLLDLFLLPEIHWGDKAASLVRIAEGLGVGVDTLVFVDDQPFERDAVTHALPEVATVPAEALATLLERADLSPREVTDEARARRAMMRGELRRRDAEASHGGTPRELLETLGLSLRIAEAEEADLARAEELTLRTNQLNTTGVPYDRAELARRLASEEHRVIVARLSDRYGDYGTIGLALVSRDAADARWVLELFLLSCRVMARGVGPVFLGELLRRAEHPLAARFRETGRNRAMYVTYRFAGFREARRDGQDVLLVYEGGEVAPAPHYVALDVRVRALA